VLLGLRGKVVWVTFWSSEAADSRSLLDELEKAHKQLGARGRFAMAAVAADHDHLEAVRAVKRSVPVYLATPETLRSYGVVSGRLPLHVLIDDESRIGVIAHGADRETVARLTHQAQTWLDALEPFGDTHFADLRPEAVVKSPGP
jgi:hypothetical protein